MKTINKYTLSPEQDKEYVKIFESAKGLGLSDKKADKEAHEHICKIWPEIKKFDKVI
jgi:hypothetical protein